MPRPPTTSPLRPELDCDDLLTVAQAARRVRMARARVKQLADAAGISIPWGEKQVKVQVKELWRAILDQRQRAEKPRAQAKKLHPLVKC